MANPYVNKVVLGDETLLDLTEDTATESDVMAGKTFHLASGALATGTATTGGGSKNVWFGTCNTYGGVSSKSISCGSDFVLAEGAVLIVRFAWENIAENISFNVNNTGSVGVSYRKTIIPWTASDILTFVYRNRGDGVFLWSFVATNNPLALMDSASTTSRGVVQVGDGLDIDSDGVLSVASAGQHSITLIDSAVMYGHCASVSTDGTYTAGSYVSGAFAGDTVTASFVRNWDPTITRADTGEEITTTYVKYDGASIYTFTMPDADVNIDCWYND